MYNRHVTDIELRALELKRRAWEALAKQTGTTVLFRELSQMERQTPEFFELVVKQLEADNGRWLASSALPNVKVKRDSASKIEEISFFAIDSECLDSQPSALVWRSDHGDREWIEDFAKDYSDQ